MEKLWLSFIGKMDIVTRRMSFCHREIFFGDKQTMSLGASVTGRKYEQPSLNIWTAGRKSSIVCRRGKVKSDRKKITSGTERVAVCHKGKRASAPAAGREIADHATFEGHWPSQRQFFFLSLALFSDPGSSSLSCAGPYLRHFVRCKHLHRYY